MGPSRTSLRFVVGTALLSATTAAAVSGCDKPNINTPADDKPNINTPPPPDATIGEPEVNPGQGPIVNTVAPQPEPQPQPEQLPPPIVNTPPELEPPTINTAPVTKKPQPVDPPPKKYVNTRPD